MKIHTKFYFLFTVLFVSMGLLAGDFLWKKPTNKSIKQKDISDRKTHEINKSKVKAERKQKEVIEKSNKKAKHKAEKAQRKDQEKSEKLNNY